MKLWEMRETGFMRCFSPIADRVFCGIGGAFMDGFGYEDWRSRKKLNTEIRLKSSNAVRWSFIQLMCCRMERYTRAVISDRHLNLGKL